MSKAPSHYIPSLDGIRALAVTLVFVAHAGLGNLVPGGFGVTVFFFLSGYLITTLLVKEYADFGSVDLKAFYVRRVIRLAPPLLITLVGAWIAAKMGLVGGDLDAQALLSQLFFFHNYHIALGGKSFVDGTEILWSLAVEEHFYLIFPAIFIIFNRHRISENYLLLIIIAILAWRVLRYYLFHDTEWTIYLLTDTRFDSILYGCFLAMTPMPTRERWFPRGRKCSLIVGTAIIALLLTFIVRDDAFRSTLRYTVQGFALMPLFHYAVTNAQSAIVRPLNWKPVRQIGVYSYTIYLVHFVVLKCLERATFAFGHPVVVAIAAAVISTAIAAVIYRFVERPLKPFRLRFASNQVSASS